MPKIKSEVGIKKELRKKNKEQKQKGALFDINYKYDGDYQWKLGKINNKYLILEIMGYSGSREKVSKKLFYTSKMLRVLIIRNRKAYLRIMKINKGR